MAFIFVFTPTEIIVEADGLGNGSTTWAAKWMAIRATVLAVVKMFIFPSVGKISDKIGRRELIMIALYASAINTFIFGAIFTNLWYWVFVALPISALTEAGYQVIGAGIKDTIPHEQFNMVDADNANDENNDGLNCCTCCIPKKFSAVSQSRLFLQVVIFFVIVGILSVVVVKAIFMAALGNNFDANRATYCVGSFFFLLTAIYTTCMLPETIDPSDRKESSLKKFFLEGGFRNEIVSPVTAWLKLFGAKQIPQVRVYAYGYLVAQLVAQFSNVNNLYVLHRWGMNIVSTWGLVFAWWLAVTFVALFFVNQWLRCCGQRLLKEKNPDHDDDREEDGVGERNAIIAAAVLGAVIVAQISPWIDVPFYGIVIPISITVMVGAVPATVQDTYRKRLLPYNQVAEYKTYLETLTMISIVALRIPLALLWAWCIEQNALAGTEGCPSMAQHAYCEGDSGDLTAHLETNYGHIGGLNMTAVQYVAGTRKSLGGSCGAADGGDDGSVLFYEGQCTWPDLGDADADAGGSSAVVLLKPVKCTNNLDDWNIAGTGASGMKWGRACDKGLPLKCAAAEAGLEEHTEHKRNNPHMYNTPTVLEDCWKENNCGFHGMDESRCPGMRAAKVNLVTVIPSAISGTLGFALLLMWIKTEPWAEMNRRAREENSKWTKREGTEEVKEEEEDLNSALAEEQIVA